MKEQCMKWIQFPLKQAERTRCEEGFEAFMKMHDETIKRMKERGMSRKGCFGF